MKIEKNEILDKCLSEKRGEKYDIAVSYSGGKDSAFLIYLLKEVYKMRVVAVSIDNGFEFPGVLDGLEEFPKNVSVPLEIITPDREFFIELYKNLIISPNELKDGKRNHICHICNNIIWSQVTLYASENNIPYVASGLGLEQLNSGRAYPLEINQFANRIAEKSTRKIFQMICQYVANNSELSNNSVFMEQFARLKNSTNSTSTIYPYIYHTLTVEDIKNTLVEYGNWHPLNQQDINTYVSSGCLIMNKVILEMEKIGMINMNEREEAKRMFASGLLNEKQASFAYKDVRKSKLNLEDSIFDLLGIREYLEKIAADEEKL